MRDFRYIDGAAILKLNEQACIGCGICVTVCPHRVFTLGKNKASITDYNAAWNAGPAPPTARPRPFTSTQTTAAAAPSDHQQMAVQDHEKKSRFGLLLNKSDDQRCGCECEPRIEMVVYKLLRKIADKRGVIGKYNVRNEEFFHCQVRAIKNEIQLTFR